MKKILIAIALCCALLATVNVPVMASTFSESKYNVDYFTSEITISADTVLPLTRVTLVVLNPGKTLADAAEGTGALQYQRELLTDNDGKFTHTFTVNFEEEPTDSVVLEVYAKVPASSAQNIADIYYASQDERIGLIEKLKGDSSDIEAIFLDENAMQSLGLSNFAPYAEVDSDELAISMEGNFDGFEETAEGFDKACAYIRKFVVLEMFNQNVSSKVFDEQGNYLMNDTLSFAEYDKVNGTTIWECYNELLTENAKKAVRKSLFGNEIETPEELYKKFAENTVLIGLTNAAKTGYGHVEKLLTDENCKLIGLKVSGKITGSIEASIAAESGFESVSDLENFIGDLLEKANSNNKNNGGGSSGGGGGKTAGGSIIVSPDYPVKPVVSQETVIFNDVDEGHWAVKAVAYLKSKGIVNGAGGNNFLPDNSVTREEVVKMIFAIVDTDLNPDAVLAFDDTAADAWYVPYIATAVEQGYINGISETEFGTGLYATRQDICTIIARVLELESVDQNVFTDSDSIADYAESAISALYKNGIVSGYPDGSFRPNANCTRAEVANIIYNAVKYLEVK